MIAEQVAQAVWAYGTNDDVWSAMFDAPNSTFYPTGLEVETVEVAAELLEKIEATPDWTVGDLTHEQAVAAIRRRYPLL